MDEARAAGVSDTRKSPSDTRVDRIQVSGITAHVSSVLTGCSDASERAQRVLALLCHKGPSTRGFLFLLGSEGLTLRASNAVCHAPALRDAFAQSYLDLELKDSDLTLTEVEVTAMLNAGSANGVFLDQDGARYRAHLLAAELEGCVQIVGIAMLTQDAAASAIQRMAIEVARQLLDLGDVHPARAA
jgi:hypothetical protein